MSDFTLLAQHRLTQFHEGSWVSTSGVVVEETLPTGKYNQLGNRPSNGIGAGACTTTLGFYPQTYFWLPNGRILRLRFDVTQSFSTNAKVEGVNLYGTDAGFSGYAKPGRSSLTDPAWEYSLSKKFVLVCVMTGGAKDEPQAQIKKFGTIVSELDRLAQWLVAEGCTHAVMESTGSYWKPVFKLLVAHVRITLANAADVQNRRGHKTDPNDSRWLAHLLRTSGSLPWPSRSLRKQARHRCPCSYPADHHPRSSQGAVTLPRSSAVPANRTTGTASSLPLTLSEEARIPNAGR